MNYLPKKEIVFIMVLDGIAVLMSLLLSIMSLAAKVNNTIEASLYHSPALYFSIFILMTLAFVLLMKKYKKMN